MRVTNTSEVNVTMDPNLLLKKYESTIKELKMELMMHDALANRNGITYDEYTSVQKHELQSSVRAYIDAGPMEEDNILPVQSIRQVKEIFKQFKLLIKNIESGVEEKLREEFTLGPKETGAIGASGAPGN